MRIPWAMASLLLPSWGCTVGSSWEASLSSWLLGWRDRQADEFQTLPSRRTEDAAWTAAPQGPISKLPIREQALVD